LPFCYHCRYSLQLGIEKFCPNCSYNLQKGQAGQNVISANVTGTQGDVFGSGFTGEKNIIAKDTKGNIINFNIGSITTEQLKYFYIFNSIRYIII
jgi:hypothetical protein